MRRFSSLLVATAFLLSLFAALPGKARADSFTVYNLGGDDVHLIGIDSSGTVLISRFNGCNGGSDPNYCYEEFSAGVMSYMSDTAPTNFIAQNGAPCAAPAGIAPVGKSVCDGTYQVAGGLLNDFPGVWEGSAGAGLGALVYEGTADLLYLNTAGDFVALNGLNDSLQQVMVATTPEPPSMLLLVTGVLGLGGTIRRRLRAN